MTIWLARGIRRRVVTTRYPRVPEPTTAGLPTPPIIRADLLDEQTADALARVCPSRALLREGDELVYDAGRCTCCGRCLIVAPGVVRASGVFELATPRREDLVRHVPIHRRPA